MDAVEWNEAANSRPELAEREPDAVRHFRVAIQQGRPWQEALLEAIGMWTLPEEGHRGRHYQYLLQGEAFDWLLLAERLLTSLDGANACQVVPEEEREQLLLHGLLPQDVSPQQFRRYVGPGKYRALLNFWYGVVAEETLQLAVEEEIRKDRRAKGLPDTEEILEQAALRIYEDTRSNLLKKFRTEMGYPQRNGTDLTEIHEFTYWLFKVRVKNGEPARVASDTRKGLERLKRLRGGHVPL